MGPQINTFRATQSLSFVLIQNHQLSSTIPLFGVSNIFKQTHVYINSNGRPNDANLYQVRRITIQQLESLYGLQEQKSHGARGTH